MILPIPNPGETHHTYPLNENEKKDQGNRWPVSQPDEQTKRRKFT